MRMLFKLATRSRPEKFLECMQNIHDMVRDFSKDKCSVLVSVDEDDETMQREKMEPRMAKFVSFGAGIRNPVKVGRAKNKIEAINRDIEWYGKFYEWDILINTSDDMLFTKKWFDDEIRFDMQTYFPDLDGFLHYNDGNQKDNVCTMSIMGRKYYDRFGYIYRPDYKSVWCDVEATEVAYMLGKYKYMGDDKILFRHLHPAFGLAEYDEQYRRSENLDVWGEDLQTLLERKARHYDLSPKEIITNYKYPPSEMIKWQSELNNARQNKGMQPIEF